MRPASLLLRALLCLGLLAGGALPAARAGDDPKIPPGGEAKPAQPAPAPRPAPETKPAPEVAGPVRPGSLRDLARRLDALAARVARIVEAAQRDPDEAFIDLYLAYGAKELKNRKRGVRAKDLVGFMVDPTNSEAVRKRAQEALRQGTERGDIELSATSKRAGMTERALFCRNEVVEHLRHDDRTARQLAFELLQSWYRVRNVTAILSYKYDEKRTWPRAISAWKKELKRN